MKKFLLVMMFVLSLFLIVGCGKEEEAKKATFELSETEATIKVNKDYTLPIVLDGNDELVITAEPAEGLAIEGKKLTASKEGTYTVTIGLKDNAEFKKEFKLIVNSDSNPEITLEEGTEVSVAIEIGDAFDAKAGVKATDKEDGDITANITVSNFDITKAGAYEIVYTVLDSDGNKAELKRTLTVSVKDETAPVLKLKDGEPEVKKIKYGETYDASDIIATDDIDGDVSASIKFVTPADSKRYNEQTVVVEASDAKGNKAQFERKIQVEWDYQTMYIGHAGSYYGIANTEEAFINAAKTLHYQAIECDLKQTSDGVFVMCHDDTFASKTIASTTWANLKDVVNTGSRTSGYPGASGYDVIPNKTGQYSSTICTLERYLEICKEYGCIAVIELKSSPGITNSDQSRMQALMNEIEKVGMLHQVTFLASQYNCLIWVKQHGYEYIPCQYLVNSFESQTVFDRCKQYGFEVSTNVTGDYSNNDTWLQKYQNEGIKVSTWTFTQYVDYDIVQNWIDKGVDYVTCDWQEIEKLKNYKKDEPVVKHKVEFYGVNNTLIDTLYVRDGAKVEVSDGPEVPGYEFIIWDKDLDNVTEDTKVTAIYDIKTYEITYVANASKKEEVAWANKEAFVSEFYTDLYNWLDSQVGKMNGLSKTDSTYKLVNNSSANGTATWTDVASLRALDLYVFEASISCHLYKQIEGSNSASYIPLADENYFLNCDLYRVKYQNMNAYLLNCIQTSYTSYSTVFKPASNDRVQIFFRFHQWCKGTNIAAFNTLPKKFVETQLPGVSITLPTDKVSYTIEDAFVLPEPVVTGATFLGWYTNPDGTGDKVTEIKKGSSGKLVLYAKWQIA